MSKPHKWAREIHAWADGAEIEWRWLPSIEGTTDNWRLYQKNNSLDFFQEGVEYRIKPQPKEPQYLYVYADGGWPLITFNKNKDNECSNYLGKIKLESNDD